jgi:hypothetical protein
MTNDEPQKENEELKSQLAAETLRADQWKAATTAMEAERNKARADLDALKNPPFKK